MPQNVWSYRRASTCARDVHFLTYRPIYENPEYIFSCDACNIFTKAMLIR